MVFICCVKNCFNKNPDVQMYSFPTDSKLFRLWLDAVQHDDLYTLDQRKVIANYRICDVHFSRESKFLAYDQNGTSLCQDAVPTLLLNCQVNNSEKKKVANILKVQELDFRGSDIKTRGKLNGQVDYGRQLLKTYGKGAKKVESSAVRPPVDMSDTFDLESAQSETNIECVVCGQFQDSNTTHKFFPWPTDPTQRKTWQNCLGVQVLNLDDSDLFICSDHIDNMIAKGICLEKSILLNWIYGDDIPASAFDDEEIVPEHLRMINLLQLFVAATKERPSNIIPSVTPVTKEIRALFHILIERQERFLGAYCKSCLRQTDLITMAKATHEGIPVVLMYKTVFMTEVISAEIPEVLCRTCIEFLFQCYKFVSMTAKSSKLLQATKERFKYLPALYTGELMNMPQIVSAKVNSHLVDEAGKIETDGKRKSTVEVIEVPEKNARLTDDFEDDTSFDCKPILDEKVNSIEAEIQQYKDSGDENYCVICRLHLTKMARHMTKMHQIDWISKNCLHCNLSCSTAVQSFKHYLSHHTTSYFKCQYCLMSYDDQKGLDRHMRLSSCREQEKKPPKNKRMQAYRERLKLIQKPYLCQKCGFSSTNFKVMFEHSESEHTSTLDCIFCLKSFHNKFCLYCHFKVHGRHYYCANHFKAFNTKEELLEHFAIPGHNLECGACFQVFPTEMEKYTHKKTHKGKETTNIKQEKEEDVKCTECNIIFTYKASLKRHQDTLHKKLIVFLCEDCGQSYNTKYQLRVHSTKKHNKNTGLVLVHNQCELCGKTYETATELKTHIAVTHYDFHCRYCFEGFSTAELLEDHEKEANHEWFVCDKCSGQYKSLAKLQLHINRVHENDDLSTETKTNQNPNYPRKCQRRPVKSVKSFSSRNRKGRTRRKWTPLANGRYSCSTCHKEFKSVSTLIKHSDLHSESPKYKCHCGKEFWQLQCLKQHYSVHSNERPFPCKICGKAFKDSSTFYKHRKIHGFISKRNKEASSNDNDDAKNVGQKQKKVSVLTQPGDPQISEDSISLMFNNINNEEWLPSATNLEKFVQG